MEAMLWILVCGGLLVAALITVVVVVVLSTIFKWKRFIPSGLPTSLKGMQNAAERLQTQLGNSTQDAERWSGENIPSTPGRTVSQTPVTPARSTCGYCGTSNAPGSTSCAGCGADL